MRLRMGTRGSRLARTQSGLVARALEARGHEVQTVVLRTAGDERGGVPFAEIGAPGVFVREIERALLEHEIDLAVHSYKDLPSEGPSELIVAAVPGRGDPRDVLFVRPAAEAPSAVALPLADGARVGTASARRSALLADLRPDLRVELLRGNVPTRLGRLAAGEIDAILLAAAGVDRLEASDGEPLPTGGLARYPLAPEEFVPAPSQGALALQVRADDGEARAAAAALDDPDAHRHVRAERALLALVGGSCDLPFGAWCATEGGALVLRALLGTPRGLLRAQRAGDDPDELAAQTWAALQRAGELTP